MSNRVAAVIAQGKHPVTFRTRKLSSAAPMVLHSGGCGRVGRRRTIFTRKAVPQGAAFRRSRTLSVGKHLGIRCKSVSFLVMPSLPCRGQDHLQVVLAALCRLVVRRCLAVPK